MARTAVIAGTATATSHAVSGAMQGATQRKQQGQAAQVAGLQTKADLEEMKAQMAAMQTQQAQAALAPAGGTDLLAQLQQLAQLKEAGALTDEEFAAAKAKVLGS